MAVRRGPGGFAQNVCIKRILPAFESDAEFVESFLQEARMSAALRHANIVQVLDFGVADDSHYLALELIDGLDLRGLLGGDSDRRVLLDPELVTLIAADVGAALEHAHSDAPGRASVVHRDVSPSNVLISTAGEVKLTDFGIARATSGRGRTATGIIKGKVPYMPPEYIDRSAFDPRGDLFSLGVMMYEALAGQRPFDGHSDIDTIRRIVAGTHAHLGAVIQGVPAHLVQCVERLLAVRPDDRFPSARAFVEALPPLATHRVRRRLGDLVRQRMQELDLVFELPTAPTEPAQPSPHNPGGRDAVQRETPGPYVPDSRIDRLPVTHTREPILLSGPSTDPRARGRGGPSKRALAALGASGALLAVVIVLFLLRPQASETERPSDAAPSATRELSTSAAPPAATPNSADKDWRPDTAEAPPSALPPMNNTGGADHDPTPVVTPEVADAVPPAGSAIDPPPSVPVPEPFPQGTAKKPSHRPRPPKVQQTETSAKSALGQLAELKIFVSPFGDVWVDGKRLGQAPVTIKLEAGVHEVAVGDGRPKERRSIELRAGQTERLEITRRDVMDSE